VALTPSSPSVVLKSVVVGRSSGKCGLPVEVSLPQICRTPPPALTAVFSHIEGIVCQSPTGSFNRA
jgi:hypothetical protein